MKDLNKSAVITKMMNKTGLTKKDTTSALNAFRSVVEEAVENHTTLRLVGFLTVKVEHRKARKGRNPQTGKPLKIAARDVPSIKAGKGLRKLANKQLMENK